MNTTERQFTTDGRLITFKMTCMECEVRATGFSNSWAAQKTVKFHRREYKHNAKATIDGPITPGAELRSPFA